MRCNDGPFAVKCRADAEIPEKDRDSIVGCELQALSGTVYLILQTADCSKAAWQGVDYGSAEYSLAAE